MNDEFLAQEWGTVQPCLGSTRRQSDTSQMPSNATLRNSSKNAVWRNVGPSLELRESSTLCVFVFQVVW